MGRKGSWVACAGRCRGEQDAEASAEEEAEASEADIMASGHDTDSASVAGGGVLGA